MLVCRNFYLNLLKIYIFEDGKCTLIDNFNKKLTGHGFCGSLILLLLSPIQSNITSVHKADLSLRGSPKLWKKNCVKIYYILLLASSTT